MNRYSTIEKYKKRVIIPKEINAILYKIAIEEKTHPDIIREIYLTQFAFLKKLFENPDNKKTEGEYMPIWIYPFGAFINVNKRKKQRKIKKT